MPQKQLNICTTGFDPGRKLNEMAHSIHKLGHHYEPELTARTNVLVVQHTTSSKYQQAKRHRVPMVTEDWIYSGKCDVGKLDEFGVPPLLGAVVVTTSLSLDAKQAIRNVCESQRAKFETALTRACKYLVVPSHGSHTTSDKARFAIRHKIEMLTEAQFFDLAGVAQPQQSPQAGAPAAGAPHRNRQPEAQAAPAADMGGVVCYFSPAAAITADHKKLCQLLGVRRVPIFSKAVVTHVIILGDTAEYLDLDEGEAGRVQVVSAHWLVACRAEQARVPVDPYRLHLYFGPTITLGSLASSARQRLLRIIDSLGGRAQDDLVVGAVQNGGVSRPTTHLVLPTEAAAASHKVQALHKRMKQFNRTDCRVVDVKWIEASCIARRWVDIAAFEIDIAALFEQQQQQQQQQLQRIAASEQKQLPMQYETTTGDPDATEAASQKDAPPSPEGAATSTQKSSQGRGEQRGSGGGGVSLSLEALMNQVGCVPAAHSAVPSAPVRSPTTSASNLFLTKGSYSGVPESSASRSKQVSPLAPPSMPPPWLMSTRGTYKPAATDEPLDASTSVAPQSSSAAFTSKSSALSLKLKSSNLFSSVFAAPFANSKCDEEQQRPTTAANIDSQVVFYEHNMGGIDSQPGRGKHAPVFSLLLAKSIRDELSDGDISTLMGMGVLLADSVEACTHYVLTKPCKTETFLCAVASGKWIVDKGFVRALIVGKGDVDDETFEWNLDRLPPNSQDPSANMLRSLVPACALQRLRGAGYFREWIVSLVCDDSARQTAFEHVLRCGGCTHIKILHSSSIDLLENCFAADVSHVLCDDTVGKVAPRIRQLVDERCTAGPRVLVQRLEFLVHCLSSHGAPDTELYDAVKRQQVGKKRPISTT